MTSTVERLQVQRTLLAGGNDLIKQIRENLVKGYKEKYGEEPGFATMPTIRESAKLIANATHDKAIALDKAGKLDSLPDNDFVALMLATANTALKNNSDNDIVIARSADEMTGYNKGTLDLTSRAYTAMLASLKPASPEVAAPGASAATSSKGTPPSTDPASPPAGGEGSDSTMGDAGGDKLKPGENPSLYRLYRALGGTPQAQARTLQMLKDPSNAFKGKALEESFLIKFIDELPSYIRKQAEQNNIEIKKFTKDGEETDSAEVASEIIFNNFKQWITEAGPDVANANPPLTFTEVNKTSRDLAVRIRNEMMRRSDELGGLGKGEIIDRLVGLEGDGSNGTADLNVVNISQAILVAANGDPLARAQYESKARTSLKLQGELTQSAIYSGLSGAGLNPTAENYFINAANQAKRESYDSGFFGTLWQALCIFFSALMSGEWDVVMDAFGYMVGNHDPKTNKFAERMEYDSKNKFESNFESRIMAATPQDLAYEKPITTKEGWQEFAQYKRGLLNDKLERIYASAAGLDPNDPNAIASVRAPAAPVSLEGTYLPLPGEPTPITLQTGLNQYKAWQEYIKGDANPDAVFVYTNDNTALLLSTASSFGNDKGQIDPIIAEKAKQAAAHGNTLIVEDRNGDRHISGDEEIREILPTELRKLAEKLNVQLVPR